MFEQTYPGLYYITLYDNIVVQFQVAVNEQNFPDTNFRNWVKAQSYGSDGILTKAEIAAVTRIDVSYESISSLKGIEYFTALTKLNCNSNRLTSLDVSGCTALTVLSCYVNDLTTLDVSNNTKLEMLDCNSNRLTSLDVSKNTALAYMYCHDNQLKSLDVSGCTALSELNCNLNELTTLDVSNNTALYYLNCRDNQLTSLDVSGCTKLESLDCYYNNLTSLDVSNNTALTKLDCEGNQLASLNVSGCTALTALACDGNQMASLDVSGCTALTELYCTDNHLTTLDVSKNTALIKLQCYKNLIRGKGMTDLVSSLPDRNSDTTGYLWAHKDETPAGNLMTPGQVEAATSKNWKVSKYDAAINNTVDYEGETVPGDANGDGEVNVTDIDCLRDYILGLDPQPFSFESADLDESGTVDIVDLTKLIVKVKK